MDAVIMKWLIGHLENLRAYHEKYGTKEDTLAFVRAALELLRTIG